MNIFYAETELKSIVQKHLIPLMEQCRIFTFRGPLGAGKTALIKIFLHECGVGNDVTSPSFSYVNVYHDSSGRLFYHFDLYRINSTEGFVGAGFDEYVHQENAVCLIEWPEVIDTLLSSIGAQECVCDIAIGYIHNDLSKRSLKIACR